MLVSIEFFVDSRSYVSTLHQNTFLATTFVLFIILFLKFFALFPFILATFLVIFPYRACFMNHPVLLTTDCTPSHLCGSSSMLQKHNKNSSNFIVQVFETPQVLTNVSEMDIEQLLLLLTRMKIDICPETKQLQYWIYLIRIS